MVRKLWVNGQPMAIEDQGARVGIVHEAKSKPVVREWRLKTKQETVSTQGTWMNDDKVPGKKTVSSRADTELVQSHAQE